MKKGLLILEAVTGLAALVCGGLLVIWPDGSAIGLPLLLLQTSPFDSFIIPGFILALVIGGSQLVALLAGIGKIERAGRWTLTAGVLLIGWIIVQLIMIRQLSWLQLTCFCAGLIQVVYGWQKSGNRKGLAGCDIL